MRPDWRLYLMLIILPLASCIRDTELDSGERPQVVVECILTNSPVQTLRLCFTKGASREREPLTQADARLYDVSENKEAGRFLFSDADIWTLRYEPTPGHTYRLKVNVPGYEPVLAEQTMPEIHVRAVYYWPVFGSSDKYEYNSSPLIVYELESLPDFTWVYAMSWDQLSGERRIADNLCTDFPYVDNFNLTGDVYDPQVDTVFQYGLEFHYAKYWPLKGASVRRKYLRIPYPKTVDKNWLIVSGDMEGYFPYELNKQSQLVNDGVVEDVEEGQGYVVFAAISKDYDAYLMDAIRIQLLQESSDLSSIYLRENIYSNITGGLGIFGARAEQKMVWMNEKSFFEE